MVQHAVSEVGTGNREPDSLDLIPVEIVFDEKLFHALDPSIDHGLGSELGVCGALRKLECDRRAVFVNPAGLRGGCAAVSADKDGFHVMLKIAF